MNSQENSTMAAQGAKKSITSLPMEALHRQLAAMGQPAFRARQVFGWLHQKQVSSFGEMTNLPAALRQQLDEEYYIDAPQVKECLESRDGTKKLLLALPDGECVETVLMQYNHGLSVCISSQVGCRMGCRFCASGRAGLVRNLTAGEMAGQVYAAQRQAGARVGHIVMMGIGEPMDNFENALDFIEIITSSEGHGLSGRSLSLSTCGVVPGIRRLAEKKLPLTLSISLHAATNKARSRLMPVNDAYDLTQLMEACREYQSTTGRRISFEYAMVQGENDSPRDAENLAALLTGMGAHLNLIPTNSVDGSPYSASTAARINEFAAAMEKRGVRTTVRRRLGADIDAACGQLRLRKQT